MMYNAYLTLGAICGCVPTYITYLHRDEGEKDIM